MKVINTGEKTPKIVSDALVAVGSNVRNSGGDPAKTVTAALQWLAYRDCVIRAKSQIYATPAFPPGSGPDFANAAFSVQWDGSAAELLALLHACELAFGRTRETRWGPRCLDLDLIGWGDLVLPDAQSVTEWTDLTLDMQMAIAPDELILPHPRLQDRAFVLVPLMDIAPDWVHPLSGLSVTQMQNALPQADLDAIIPLVSPPEGA